MGVVPFWQKVNTPRLVLVRPFHHSHLFKGTRVGVARGQWAQRTWLLTYSLSFSRDGQLCWALLPAVAACPISSFLLRPTSEIALSVCMPPASVSTVCCFWSYYLEHFAIDPTCIDHFTRTVSECTKDNPVSFGLRDMTRRFRDCLGR